MKKLLCVFFTFFCSVLQAGEFQTYRLGDARFEGYRAQPAGESRGLVVLIHDWDGLGAYEVERAEMLAALGYEAFAIDVYGKGVRPEEISHRRALMGELFADRKLFRARIQAGLDAARAAGPRDLVVMGYCFGGAATLELARSGDAAGVLGYVSFHGGLKTPAGQQYSENMAPLLVAHGGADSSVTMGDVATLAEELEAAGAMYEIQVYSGAPHAFTVFGSDRYQQRADQRSWSAFLDFLSERLGRQRR